LPQHSSSEFDEAHLGSERHDALVMSFEPCVVFAKSRNSNDLRREEDGSAAAEQQNCSTQATVTKIRSDSGERERLGFLDVASRRVATIYFFLYFQNRKPISNLYVTRG